MNHLLRAATAAGEPQIITNHTMTVADLTNPTLPDAGFQYVGWTGGAKGGFVTPGVGPGFQIRRFAATLGSLYVYVEGADRPADLFKKIVWENGSRVNTYTVTEAELTAVANYVDGSITHTRYRFNPITSHGFSGDVGTVTITARI